MSEKNEIIIFSPEIPSSEDTDLADWRQKVGEVIKENVVDVDVLKKNVQNFFMNITNLLEDSQEVEKKGFMLDQIEFTLQISAKGQVGFLGSGAEANASGGIKFVIKRR